MSKEYELYRCLYKAYSEANPYKWPKDCQNETNAVWKSVIAGLSKKQYDEKEKRVNQLISEYESLTTNFKRAKGISNYMEKKSEVPE